MYAEWWSDCRLTVLVEAPLLTEVVLRPTVEFCLVAVAFVLLFLTDEPDLLVVPGSRLSQNLIFQLLGAMRLNWLQKPFCQFESSPDQF